MRYLLLLCSLLISTPVTAQIGQASWYGKSHQGRRMANGQRFDMNRLTMACWGIPFGIQVLVVNLRNGQNVIVEVTDRGPNHRLNRVADLSAAAADKLGYRQAGLTTVALILLVDQISSVLPQVVEESMSYRENERETIQVSYEGDDSQ